MSDVETFVEPSDGAAAAGSAQIEGRSPAQIAWNRIKRDKVTVGSLIVVCVIVVLAVVAPILRALHVIDPSTPHPELVQGPGSVPTGAFGGASAKHLLGVIPGSGTDLLSRVFLGITLDLSIAIAATVITVAAGVAAGLAAGYYGKWTDGTLGRVMDIILAFPQLLMLLALSPLFIGQPAKNVRVIVYLIVVFAVFGWPYFARIVRGEVLSLREREFVEAARSMGARGRWILWRELLPNLRAAMLVYATIILPTYVAEEAALAYLGVSVDPSTTPTVGNLLSDSVNYSQTDPTYFLVPGVTLVLIVLSFNLLGDGLGDALNPKTDRL